MKPTIYLFQIMLALALSTNARADLAKVDQAADALVEAGAAGVSMAIVNGHGLVWAGARGTAGRDRMMTADTVMNIASISKTFTATSLMLLVERGKLDLDRNINDYLDFSVAHPAYPDTAITAT